MSKKTPIINIFTYGLPQKLAKQIFNEYQSRLSESKFLIEKYNYYLPLLDHIKTLELLLAMSIFYKRVVTNLDSAIKFHSAVNRYSGSEVIQIGSYDFTGEEKNKLLGLIINFNNIQKKFSIPKVLYDYEQTKDFVKNVLSLLEYGIKAGKKN